MSSRVVFMSAFLAALLAGLTTPRTALAYDGGADAAGDDAAASDDGGDGGGSGGSSSVPLACGGALCDTSNEASCTVAERSVGVADGGGAQMVLFALAAAVAFARARRSPRGARAIGVFAVIAGASLPAPRAAAAAEHEPGRAVDVRVVDPPPPPRRISIEWNPLPLFTIGRASGNVVFVPFDHHALVLSPFYAWSKTEPIYVIDASGTPIRQLPEQHFRGFGAELGYRWYSGRGGPRGLFVGPSLVLGSFTASAADGTDTSYLHLGVAADIGYQVLVADSVALSLGVGVQYTTPSKSLPDQQFPADLYANALVRPRVLSSLGWAF